MAGRVQINAASKVQIIPEDRRVIVEAGGCCKHFAGELPPEGQGVGSPRGFGVPASFSGSVVRLEYYDYIDPVHPELGVEFKHSVEQTGFFDLYHAALDAYPHGLNSPQSQMYGQGGFWGDDSRLGDKFLVAPFVRFACADIPIPNCVDSHGVLSMLLWISCQVDRATSSGLWGRILQIIPLPFDPVGSELAADWNEAIDGARLYGGLTTSDSLYVRTWGRYRLPAPEGVGAIDGSLFGSNVYQDDVPTVPGIRRYFSVTG